MTKGFETTFACDNMVRPKHSKERPHDVAFGRVLIDGGWHGAYCPQSVVRRMQPRKGGVYVAQAVPNPREGATSPYMVVRIERPVMNVLSDMAQSNILGYLGKVGVSSATEITEHLWSEHDVIESDVWITLQQMWNEGSVSRISMTRDSRSHDHATLWAAKDFELSELLDG